MEGYLRLLRHLMPGTRGLRRLGSAALDLAYVAAGRFEGFFETNLKPWDVAAGALLVSEAGGQVSDFAGQQGYVYGASLVASNGFIHQEILQAIIDAGALRGQPGDPDPHAA
jgi:myo-inositol-1(or 4)-monophosphatase